MLIFALVACESGRPNMVTLEYESYCPLHVEEGKDYQKLLPICEENGSIIIYSDSICFTGPSDLLNFVIYPISFMGEPNMSRIICKTSTGKDVVFVINSQRFSLKYEAAVIMQDGGLYFNVIKVK